MKHYSQYGQDAFVDKYLNAKTKGVFLDIGAHDGVHLSNTLFFEQSREWKGICIEPNPRTFQRLKNNRNCICIEAAISNKEGRVQFLDLEGLEPLGGVLDKYDPRHLARIEKDMIEYDVKRKEIIEVRCLKINQLLNEVGYTKIDYCSIDTEGGELDILKSIDFKSIDIDLLSVEINYHESSFFKRFLNRILHNSVESFLKSKGYQYLTSLGCDVVYKKEPK